MKRNYIGFPGIPFQVGKEKGGMGYRDLHLFNLAMLGR
jgi:hypothetical protein